MMLNVQYLLRVGILPCACALLSACSSAPSAELTNWSLTRQTDDKAYAFVADAVLKGGEGGWFMPDLLLIDERGCLRNEYLDSVHPQTSSDPDHVVVRLADKIPARWKIARAKLTLTYHSGLTAEKAQEQVVFSEERVIDPSLRPPNMPSKPCSSRNAELRKRAVKDPDGADADAINHMSRNEVLATAINTAGFLCARVTDAYPSQGSIIVNCREYRNGRGRVRYRVDTSAMEVTKIF